MTDKRHKIIKPEEEESESKPGIDDLQKQIEENCAKAAEYFDGWQRERADFMNYKKRIERDQQVNHQNQLATITKKYLAVLDDMDRALKARPVETEGAKWAEGIELIYRKLQGILESDGIKEIEAENQQFDPNYHEALTHEDSKDYESGQIIEVIHKGYQIGDRVIRPALVRVAR